MGRAGRGRGDRNVASSWLSNVLYQGNKNRTKKGRKSATVRLSLLRTGAHSLQLIRCLFIISFVMYFPLAPHTSIQNPLNYDARALRAVRP